MIRERRRQPRKTPPAIQKKLNAELAFGEKLLFSAIPDWRAERVKYLIIFVFGALWMAVCAPLALFTWGEALGHPLGTAKQQMGFGLSLFFSLFLIPFVVIGLGLLLAPFYTFRRSLKTVHALTDQRLVTLVADKLTEVDSVSLKAVNTLRRKDHANGTGTLVIGYGIGKGSDGDCQPLTLEWLGIDNAIRAERLIRENVPWDK